MTARDEPTEQTPRDRVLRLYDELDYALRALNEIERKVTQRPAQDQREVRFASHVADAIVHLAEARAALFRASRG